MGHVPGDARADAELIVEHLRALLAESSTTYPRGWSPQATFDELEKRQARHPIHLHPALHHLHSNWDMGALGPAPGGRRPRSRLRRLVHRYLEASLAPYFQRELEFRAALAQSIDAVARRIDEVASVDERNLLDVIRDDLVDLARYVEASVANVRAPLEQG